MKLQYPVLFTYAGDKDDLYVSQDKDTKVEMRCVRSGWVGNMDKILFEDHVAKGTYVIQEPYYKEDVPVSTLSLKVETDASSLTNALAEANTQASTLEATLQRIKNTFN